jgi:F0F1-type ATP synthase epsilon subunit
MSDEAVAGPGAEVEGVPEVGLAAPSTALVELEDGLAIVVGDHVPEGLDLIPFTFVDPATLDLVATAAGNAVGLASVAAQGANAAVQAQGLVRLAPQTLAALRMSAPIVKDGWNLGTLVSGGKFAAQVRWLPATAATATSVVAAMGPAISLMVIQAQLNQIADLAQHNLELPSTVLEVVRRDQWSSVTGHYKTLVREFGHARQIGEVTEAIYQEVRGYEGELTSQWDGFETAVEQHLKALRSRRGHQDRQKYLVDNGQAIIADSQALLLAQTAWFVHQAMRAAQLTRTAASDPQDERLLKNLVAEVRELHEKTLDETEWLLDQLAREFAIIGELPGKKTFKIGATARAARDVTQMARQLQEALASVRGRDLPKQPQPLVLPSILLFEDGVPAELVRILPLRLKADERVLALADASCDRWKILGSAWVAVTDRRLLITRQDSLRQVGAIDLSYGTSDIRYVRRHSPANKAPSVDVVTRNSSLTLQFPAWAKTDPGRRDAGRLGELLASFMNLPESEVPTIHPPELVSAAETSIDAIES